MSSKIDTKKFVPVDRSSFGATAAVLVAGGVLALLSTTVVGVAVPQMAGEFGSDVASAQWVTTAYLLAAGISIPLSGWATLRFGVRRTWLMAISIFAVGSLLAVFAADFGTLSVARVVQGFGGGALEPVMLTALARLAGPARIGRVMGSTAAVMSVGPLAGPALGGLVVDTLGWRWTFVFTGIAAIVILIGSVLVLRAGSLERARLDVRGLVLLALATAFGLFGLSRAATADGFDAVTIGVLAAGVAALVGFVVSARRRGRAAIVDLGTFGHRGFGPAVWIMALMGAGIYPLFFGLPLYYVGVAGLDATTAGLLMIPYGVGTLVAMPIAGRLSDRVDGRVLVWTGVALGLAGFLGIMTTDGSSSIWTFAGIALLIGLGLGSIGSPTVSTLYRVLPATMVPSGSTILFIGNQLGGALGVSILVILIGHSEWDAGVGAAPFWLPVAVMVGIGVLATRLAGRPAVDDLTAA
ncbi:DHA2 family efflux MFS transporter permease subunit [Microbacterium sp. EST19A]|uniref:DHA2 family efflux MFS transporter permease subunit n=1 Tax=Microbacterium sp. EST19A TaxID=2862681 RepID=UPI001CBD3D3A|nr:DHA2 family efflux MFS transporter permease subunit [Microbacterium sp. EST19A]